MSKINVKTQFEGLHMWSNAPEKVAFLRNLHRHLFKVDVTVDVQHDDRDIEFFILKNDIDVFLKSIGTTYHPEMCNIRNLGSMSCEMMAKLVSEYIVRKYKNSITTIVVKVQEDDENSGILETFL